MRTFPFFETLGADIRFATRSLMKNPAFLVVVVLSLALGIAANSTIFSVLDTLLYRPLPYPHPERLVVVWETESARPDRTIPPPIAEWFGPDELRSEEHTSELQSLRHLVCRLLLEKKKYTNITD